jgi:hypothetical protein
MCAISHECVGEKYPRYTKKTLRLVITISQSQAFLSDKNDKNCYVLNNHRVNGKIYSNLFIRKAIRI